MSSGISRRGYPGTVAPMILERAMHPQWLSNTYLVAARAGADGFLVDAGGPLEPAARRRPSEHDVTVTHVLLTHHHHDHVAELARATDALAGRARCSSTPPSATLVPGATGDARTRRRARRSAA